LIGINPENPVNPDSDKNEIMPIKKSKKSQLIQMANGGFNYSRCIYFFWSL
jgi:hypothetical protein